MIAPTYRWIAGRMLAAVLAPAGEARLRGSIDGGELIPLETDSCPPPWIYERLHRSQRLASQAEATWRRRERRLRARHSGIRLQLAHATTLAARAEQQEARARVHCDEVQARAESLHQTLNPPDHVYWPTWAYALGLGLLTLLDMPLVYMAFTTFGLDVIQTGLLSALVSFLISALCHFAGSLYRRMQVSVRLLWWVIFATMAVFVVSLGALRESALEVFRSGSYKVDSQTWGASLMIISCASLMVAFLLAGHHRLEPMAAQVRRARREARRAQSAALAARARVLRLQRADAHWQGRIHALRDTTRQHLAAIDAQTRQWMATYAGANVLARDAHDLPPSLRQENLPRIAMPLLLADPERTDSR